MITTSSSCLASRVSRTTSPSAALSGIVTVEYPACEICSVCVFPSAGTKREKNPSGPVVVPIDTPDTVIDTPGSPPPVLSSNTRPLTDWARTPVKIPSARLRSKSIFFIWQLYFVVKLKSKSMLISYFYIKKAAHGFIYAIVPGNDCASVEELKPDQPDCRCCHQQ